MKQSYDPRNAKALMGLSDVFFDTGSSQKAVLYAERAVKAAPKNSGYRIKLGDAYYNVLRYRDALDEYEKAKDLGSSKADKRIAKLYPLRRIGRPEDIADTVVFLSSERASFVTGQTLSVSGGYTMM